jgi:hypothetical protein
MVKQIEIFGPDDPVIKDMLQYCKVQTGPEVFDNETGEIKYIKNNLEDRSQ